MTHWKRAEYSVEGVDEEDYFDGAPRYGEKASRAVTEEIEEIPNFFHQKRLYERDGLTPLERGRAAMERVQSEIRIAVEG